MRISPCVPAVLLAVSILASPVFAGEIHNAAGRGDLAKVKEIVEKDPKQVDAPLNRNGYTPLYYAVQGGKAEVVKYLVSKKADVNKAPRYGYSPLQLAAMYGNDKVVDAILSGKPKINVTGRYYSPLVYAVQSSRVSVVEKFLKAGADVNAGGPQNYTALHAACNYGRTEMIELLLKQKGVKIDQASNGGYTALYYACQRGDVKTAKLLIERGANPRVKTNNSYAPMPIHAAAQTGQVGIVKLLLSKKVPVDPKNYNDETPLHIAARLGNRYYYQFGTIPRKTQEQFGAVVEVLLEAGADANAKNKQKQTPLQLAVARNSYIAVNHLLPKTDDVKEIKPITGESFFHWSCKHGLDKALAILLKKHKIDIHKKDSEGRTPLVIACEGKSDGHAGVVQLLLKSGAKVNQKLDTGETVLHIAAWNGNANMINALLRAKADQSVTDKSGYTPLHLAAWNGHAPAAAALLKAGAKPDAKISGGTTPLHAAAWKGHLEAAKLLISNKANVSAKDGDGLTPLHKAAWNGHLEVVKLLLASGADVNAKDNDGYTPLVKAREQKKANVVAYLKSKGGIDSAKK